MSIIPVMKCKDIQESVSFYTGILDFEHVGTWGGDGFPFYSILRRAGSELHLSTHSGDGTFGNVVSILVEDIDGLFEKYKEQGLDTSGKKDSPVHQGPLDQSWGTREFYVTDPNGNTLRFVKR